jgi:DNA-binding NtrC family response regulator
MILIVSNNPVEADQVSGMLADKRYTSQIVTSIELLISKLDQRCRRSVLIDIDSVPVDNRSIRNLTLTYPAIYFFCMSRDRFHPELKDAICYHIYACMNKPINPEELIYWMRCIDRAENESRGPP